MPGMHGADFLKEVYRDWPETVRILILGFADLTAIVSAINEGHISRFIPKPWKDDQMQAAVSSAIKQHYYREEYKWMAQERRQFQGIFSALPLATILIDSDGIILQCNKKGIELFGNDRQEIIGTNHRNFFPDAVNAAIEMLTQKETFFEQCSIGKDIFNVRGSWTREPGEKEAMILFFDPVK
jgi:PAS domain S-box-containing protein